MELVSARGAMRNKEAQRPSFWRCFATKTCTERLAPCWRPAPNMLHAPLAALAGPSSLPPPTQDPNRRIINGQHSTVERLHQALADSAQEYLLMQQRALRLGHWQ